MVLLIVFMTSIAATLGFCLLAAYSDLKQMLIENSTSLFIAGLFFITYAFAYFFGKTYIFAPLWIHLTSGLVMFLITFSLFSFGVLGGADSKLITALSFWIGFKGLPAFLVTMSLIGGLLGLSALLLSRFPIFANAGKSSWVARSQAGEKTVPYAVAIAAGSFAAFYHLGYLNLKQLSHFLT